MSQPRTVSTTAGRSLLLASVFLIAACGLVYELVAGAVSSYILGDAVTQFSLVIGVFLCAMGLGAYLAKFIRSRLLRTFIEVEIWIGLIGGGSSIAMFAVSAFLEPVFSVFFYTLCVLIGVLIGIEIPLLVRILNEHNRLKDVLSHVLAIDYIGALAGSILFPLVVLPYLGLSRASLVFGVMNLAVAGAGMTLLEGKRTGPLVRLALAGVLLIGGLIFSERLVGFLEDLLYQDSIVYAETTPYQRIVLTRWRDDIRLYLNGHIQLCSIDEARYHEALVIPAMSACPSPEDILILGGGDGMAAREVLKFKDVKRIVLVDLDPAMTRLGRTRPELVQLNRNSFNDSRITIVNRDALKFVEGSREFFDVILIDLPDPNTEALSKLYSSAFYALCARRLKAGGLMVTQATSPFFAPEAFWCIKATIEEAISESSGMEDMEAVPYHVHVPSFGEWGFVMASRDRIDPQRLSLRVATRFLTDGALKAMFNFGKDMQPQEEVRINRLDRPVLYGYYKKGWDRYN